MRSMSVTVFKATCLDVFDRVAAGEIDELAITRRGQVVAIVRPPRVTQVQAEALFGSMRGTLGLPDDLDLTAPVFEPEAGSLHE